MDTLGRTLMVVGAVFLAAGFLVTFFPSIPLLGKLPGDIRIERDGFRFYFPITTCILLSILLSGILYLISRLSRLR